jgi:hypothetical protein
MSSDLYQRHAVTHLRWARYYALAALLVCVLGGIAIARQAHGPFWLLNAITWYFIASCRRHRLRAWTL